MHTSMSKRLLAGLLSVVMVLSLVAPHVSTQAASSYKVTTKKSVTAGVTNTYKVSGVKKTQYIKVTKKASGVVVKYNNKTVKTSTKIKGTGKALSLKVTAPVKDANYTNKMTIKIYNAKTNKVVKTLTTSSTVKVPEKEEPTPEPDPEPTPDPEPVETLAEISGVKAVKVDTIEVTFAAAVTASDVAFAVTKGNNAVTIAAPVWNTDKTVATLTTDAKLTEGTYVVKATSAKLDKTVEGTFAVEGQKVDRIVIKDTVALTLPADLDGDKKDDESAKVRVYYDVVDQYGQSIRSTTSLTWSTSCGTPTVSASKGYIEMMRSDKKAFTYGEQIFVTAVHEKTGKSLNATLTVGMAQQLDKVEMVGFVKANTATMVESLPADYKNGEYLLAYKTVDQNGNALDAATDNIKESRVTFLSDNAMLVGTKFEDGNIAIIDGVEYNTVKIERGIKVSDGGDVTITAISNKTGSKVDKVFTVGEDVKLTTFTLGQPKKLVADGEEVELEFTALDQSGNEIKNFVNIAKGYQFNALSFSVNTGSVELVEENDGTASLWYTAPKAAEGKEMDGVDVPVVITAIVINGNGSNTQFGVQDQARPEGITGFVSTLSDTNLEGTSLTFNTKSFKYVDQYGRAMDTTDAATFLSATHVDGGRTYHYGIKLDYVGDGFTKKVADYTKTDAELSYTAGTTKIAAYDAANTIAKGEYYAPQTFVTSTKVSGKAKINDLVKFSIVRSEKADFTADDAKVEGVSPEKSISFTTVDIDMLKNIEVAAQHTVELHTDDSAKVGCTAADATADSSAATTKPFKNDKKEDIRCAGEKYAKAYGYYNGAKVLINGDYASITGAKFFNSKASSKVGEVPELDGKVTWGDLYDFTTAKNLRKPVQYDKLVYSINKVFYNKDDATVDENSDGIYDDKDQFLGGKAAEFDVIATANSKLGFSDGARTAAGIYTTADAVTIYPAYTKTLIMGKDKDDKDVINYASWIMDADSAYFNVGRDVFDTVVWSYGYFIFAYDQYGDDIEDCLTYEVKNYVENEAGEVEDNHRITGQGTASVNLAGAERGDTFDLVITLTNAASQEVQVKTVKVTVGADKAASIDNDGNNYYNYSKDGFGGLHHVLNQQRDGIYN